MTLGEIADWFDRAVRWHQDERARRART
ncbi:hypothetical protein [Ancylobacter sp. SL191]